MVKISVIIPTYKPEDYIDRAFNSLLNQTLSSDLFETIVVLNGPKQPYWDLLSRYTDIHQNLLLVYNDTPGVSNARNFGLEIAKGKYICFLDDDDYVSTNYLETMVALAEDFQDNGGIIQSNFKAVKNEKFVDDYISDAYRRLSETDYSLFHYRKFLSSVCGKLYGRELIGSIRFHSDLKIAEDAVFLFELSKDINNILLTEENCVYYRDVREGSVLRRKRKTSEVLTSYIKKIKSYFQIYFSAITQYSLPLFISRLIASSKMFIKEILYNSKY